MRNYLEMPALKEKDHLLAKPRSTASRSIVQEFASLAFRLGFDSERIQSLIQQSADEEIARKALLEARRPGRYKYDDTSFTRFVKQIVEFFSTAEELAEGTAMAVDIPLRAPRRSGIPQIGCYKRDKLSLFPDKLHSTTENQCDIMHSFFLRRSVYFAFFGKLDHFEYQELGQEQLTREEQERLAREEPARQKQLAREEQVRLALEEQARQEQLAREEQVRLALEEQARQEQLARGEQVRFAKAEGKSSMLIRKRIQGIGKRHKDRRRPMQIDFDVLGEKVNSGQNSIIASQIERQRSQIEDTTTQASDLYSRTHSQKTEIYFKMKDRNDWISAGSLLVDPSDKNNYSVWCESTQGRNLMYATKMRG